GITPGRGVPISSAEDGGLAAEAGVERGLVLYRVGKYDVRSVAQVEKLLSRAQSGTAVDFTVGIVRSGGQSPRLARVTLTAR
ncbi:MAG: hypothetical protein ACR2NX_14615, partial [Chthoniobacterales bacterium]